MSFFLAKPGEDDLSRKGRNIIKRLSLICVHLIAITHKSEADFRNIIRNIAEGHRIVEAFNSFRYKLQELLHILLTLLQFIDDRERTVEIIKKELERLSREYGKAVFINEFTLRRHFEEMQAILLKERGDLELIRNLHKELIDLRSGKFLELLQLIKGKQELFPKEHENVKNEFLYYLRKLVGAFYELSKLVTRMERLEAEEDANFAYLYALLEDKKIIEKHETDVQRTISELEREFNVK